LGSPGGRDHRIAFTLQLDEGRSGDRLDLRHDVVRALLFDDGTQRGAVEHVEHMAAVRHLHGWRIGITVHGDHFDAETLQLDDQFLAQLAAAAEQDTGRAG